MSTLSPTFQASISRISFIKICSSLLSKDKYNNCEHGQSSNLAQLNSKYITCIYLCSKVDTESTRLYKEGQG